MTSASRRFSGIARTTKTQSRSSRIRPRSLDPTNGSSWRAPLIRSRTRRYAGVLAPASKLRPKIVPRGEPREDEAQEEKPKRKGSRDWPWAQLMARSFALDVEKCPKCAGRMKLVALVQDPKSVARFLRHLGAPNEPPVRAPFGPVLFRSRCWFARGRWARR